MTDMGMNKKVKIMKLGDDMSKMKQCIFGQSKNGRKRPILCEKQSSYIKGCMEKKARFKRVVAGNGGSANGTAFQCKVKKVSR